MMQSQRSKGQRDRRLTLKQQRFIQAYAERGNATDAVRRAGYKGNAHTLEQVAYENLRKPGLKVAIEREVARVQASMDFSVGRVRSRLDHLSHAAEGAEQFAVAVRAEELIGRSSGMFVDQSIQLRGTLSSDHLAALVELARQRQAEPIDLGRPGERRRLLDE